MIIVAIILSYIALVWCLILTERFRREIIKRDYYKNCADKQLDIIHNRIFALKEYLGIEIKDNVVVKKLTQIRK
jgi:hypothetical protein